MIHAIRVETLSTQYQVRLHQLHAYIEDARDIDKIISVDLNENKKRLLPHEHWSI